MGTKITPRVIAELQPPRLAPRVVASGRTLSGGEFGILIADDVAVVRFSLRNALARVPGLAVVGEAEDGLAAIRLAEQLAPQAIIMDVSMPRLDGIEATRRIAAVQPQIKIVGFSTADDPEYRRLMGAAGAAAFISKMAPLAALLDLLERLAAEHRAGPPPAAPGAHLA